MIIVPDADTQTDELVAGAFSAGEAAPDWHIHRLISLMFGGDMNSRLFRDVPPQRYICFYPMDKKRGEQVNWYMLTLEERRAMMRSHGTIGHKYHETVTQVIAGSVGLDDWEWGVSLHSEDMLVFKKLIYEMRFDPASALYAEFGPFYVGIRREPGELASVLAL